MEVVLNCRYILCIYIVISMYSPIPSKVTVTKEADT